jgi:hypothetical protein
MRLSISRFIHHSGTDDAELENIKRNRKMQTCEERTHTMIYMKT